MNLFDFTLYCSQSSRRPSLPTCRQPSLPTCRRPPPTRRRPTIAANQTQKNKLLTFQFDCFISAHQTALRHFLVFLLDKIRAANRYAGAAAWIRSIGRRAEANVVSGRDLGSLKWFLFDNYLLHLYIYNHQKYPSITIPRCRAVVILPDTTLLYQKTCSL